MRVNLQLTIRAASNILADFGADFGRGPKRPLLRRCLGYVLARAAEGVKNLALHAQQPRIDRGGPAKPPEQGREAMNQLLLDRGLRQILRDNRVLEGPILLVRGSLEANA